MKQVPIMSRAQALAQGTTPGFLSVIANSLDRRAAIFHEFADSLKNPDEIRDLRRQATINRSNAISLRQLAKQIRNGK